MIYGSLQTITRRSNVQSIQINCCPSGCDLVTFGYNITNVLSSDAANYTCVITDDTDPANPTSSNVAQLIVNPLPIVNLNLLGTNPICDGDTTSVEAVVADDPPATTVTVDENSGPFTVPDASRSSKNTHL